MSNLSKLSSAHICGISSWQESIILVSKQLWATFGRVQWVSFRLIEVRRRA